MAIGILLTLKNLFGAKCEYRITTTPKINKEIIKKKTKIYCLATIWRSSGPVGGRPKLRLLVRGIQKVSLLYRLH